MGGLSFESQGSRGKRKGASPSPGRAGQSLLMENASCLGNPRLLAAVLFLLSLHGLPVDGLSATAMNWDKVHQELQTRYPEVSLIAPADLAAWLEDSQREPPLLVDVREGPEFEISHLPGARHVPPRSDLKSVFADIPKDYPIVTYCSVGYRSSDMAMELLELGYRNVRQLQGSLFQWANEGRVVVRDGQPVTEVHPYNRRWGTLLQTSFHPVDSL